MSNKVKKKAKQSQEVKPTKPQKIKMMPVKEIKQRVRENHPDASKKELKVLYKEAIADEREATKRRQRILNTEQRLTRKTKSTKNAAMKHGFMVEETPYTFHPSYMEHNGKYAVYLRLYVNPGTNKDMNYISVIDFIPTQTLEGVSIFHMATDALVKNEERQKVIRKNSSANRAATTNIDQTDSQSMSDDRAAKDARIEKLNDYDDYEADLATSDPLAVFRWALVITGPSPEVIENQIEELNMYLNQQHPGAMWDILPGEQQSRFENIFSELPKDRFEMTSTGKNYAGLDLAVNAGLNDEQGLPLGLDSLALTQTTAYFDFEKHTSKQAIIAMPSSSFIPRYKVPNSNTWPSAPSIIGQYAANQIVLAGHRAHHIVLNEFDYFGEKGESPWVQDPTEKREIFKVYDVDKVTLNPLQGFGDINNVVNIYARLTSKLVNIFDLMLDLSLTPNQRGDLLRIIQQYDMDHGRWSVDADRQPKRTQIVDIQNHLVPTLGDIINYFTTASKKALADNRTTKADDIEGIESQLSQSLTSYGGVLNRHTSIEETDAPQVYYQFHNIEDPNIKAIQLVNLMEYVTHTADEGDVIVIHGFDNMMVRVSEMVQESISAAKRRGIRFIFTFDKIRSSEMRGRPMNDIFSMKGMYYNDLDVEVDWSMIGTIVEGEVENIRKLLNKELGATVEQNLQNKIPNQVLVHRNAESVNNFIQLNVVI